MTVSGVGRTGESRWMTVDSWIVEDRHGWMSKWMSKRTSERSWMSKSQTCRYKEIILWGKRTEVGIRLEVDKHAGEP